jgi:putative alpha-1,2-mannosidase
MLIRYSGHAMGSYFCRRALPGQTCPYGMVVFTPGTGNG